MDKELFAGIYGDMKAVYNIDDENKMVGLYIIPNKNETGENRRVNIHSIVEAKIVGDNYSGNYFGGNSMKYSDTTNLFRFDRQELLENNNTVITYLKSDSGLLAKHILTYKDGRNYFTVSTEIINNSDRDIKLEMLSSFALYNISPFLDGAGENSMVLHRIRSKWSQEGRLVSETLEDLQLEECWCYGHSNSVRFGQVGSMPTKGYFPFMAIEDKKNGITWGVQMGCPSSWQMEVTRGDDGVCMSGGIADREFGHWMKTLKKGESFSGPEANISVCCGGVDEVCPRLLEAQEDALDIPECEEELPIIFNEYCTTWGCPSDENISGILESIKDKGIDYFVIDCGWFKEDGVRWDISMGDYIPSGTLFPKGIDETVRKIKEYGMRPGIWFEIENVGRMSKAYYNEEHLLKRDGITLTTQNRRFWDMNDEWVKDYLGERVIGFLKKHDFGYVKVDYNETIGIGCDNPDSLGEGLRQNMQGSVDFFKRIRKEIPDLVIENCASGGNRLEPCFMSLSSMASFSDAHECVEIPIIAANLHRTILPRQSQIWCVIRKNDSLKRMAYSVAAAFLGRMCFSGDVTELTKEQWDVIDRGIEFYKKASPVIKNGVTKHIGEKIKSERHPEGVQIIFRANEEMTLIVIHTFGKSPEKIHFQIDENSEIVAKYSHNEDNIGIENGLLKIENIEDFSGYGILLKIK